MKTYSYVILVLVCFVCSVYFLMTEVGEESLDNPNDPKLTKAVESRLQQPSLGVQVNAIDLMNPRDPSLRVLLDRNAINRVTGDMPQRYPYIRYDEDVLRVVAVLKDIDEEQTVRHEIANLLRRSGYAELTNVLIGILDNGRETERFRNFAVQHLYLNYADADNEKRAYLIKKFEKCLVDKHDAVRREALLSLHRTGQKGAKTIAEEWLMDANESGVHDLAIRILREGNCREAVSQIRQFMAVAKDEAVLVAAIVTLGEWQDQESESALTAFLETGTKRVQRASHLALRRIRGELPTSNLDKYKQALH